MAQRSAVRALLFDLGGVVLRIDVERALRAWAPFSSLPLPQLVERAVVDEAFRQHERGEIDAATYFAHLREQLALDASDEQIGAGWNAIVVEPFATSVSLIRDVRRRLPCYAFTNTGAYHYARWGQAFPEVVGLFERIFMSFELGMRKPETAAFNSVAQSIDCPPDQILFFDDSAENVEGARLAGLQAVQVTEPDDIARALNAAGITPPLS